MNVENLHKLLDVANQQEGIVFCPVLIDRENNKLNYNELFNTSIGELSNQMTMAEYYLHGVSNFHKNNSIDEIINHTYNEEEASYVLTELLIDLLDNKLIMLDTPKKIIELPDHFFKILDTININKLKINIKILKTFTHIDKDRIDDISLVSIYYDDILIKKKEVYSHYGLSNDLLHAPITSNNISYYSFFRKFETNESYDDVINFYPQFFVIDLLFNNR